MVWDVGASTAETGLLAFENLWETMFSERMKRFLVGEKQKHPKQIPTKEEL